MASGLDTGGDDTVFQRVQDTSSRQAGHRHRGFHGRPPADWADALRDRPPSEPPAPPIKHCGYDGPHGRQAALLLEWRELDGYYRGRIAVAAPEPDGWAIVEMWVEQRMLSPA